MSEQKILAKGKVPATEKEVNEMLDNIKLSLMTLPDSQICKLGKLLDEVDQYIDQPTRNGINSDVDFRNTIRTRFYRTFNNEITSDEINDKGRLINGKKTRMWYLTYMYTRMQYFNGGTFFNQEHQIEVKRIAEDFNAAVMCIVNKYKEYASINDDVLPYEKSHIKVQIDDIMNSMNDSLRLYNRNLEDHNIMLANYDNIYNLSSTVDK